MKKKINKKGFTLVELLVVIVILGILMVFAYPAVINVYNDVKLKAMVVEENNVRNAAKTYVQDCFDSTTKSSLNGCAYADIYSDSGYVFLGDMIYDSYTEGVKFGDNTCEGYVEFNYDKYLVCLKCGDAYKTDDIECTFDYEDTKIRSYDFNPEVKYHTFTVGSGQAGNYRIELWGAAGNTGDAIHSFGAYTSGVINLKENDTLYLYIGGQSGSKNGTSYNGGNSSGDGTPGGGSTDVRLVNGDWDNQESLASRIMVAAGGGANGAAGGGIMGYSTGNLNNNASQTAGGTSDSLNYSGGFGKGGAGCGGGSGYWGGAGADCSVGGGSGSSYISGHTGCVAIISKDLIEGKTGCLTGNASTSCSIHSSGKRFTTTEMIDGNGYSWKNTRGSQKAMPSTVYGQFYQLGRGKTGNGYARITYLGR